MSSLSLGKQGKLHDVQDDLESIFWVALYIIILYFPFDRKDAIHIIDTVINQYSFHPNGVPFGGHGKKIFIEEATLKPGDEYSIILPDTVSPPLLEWIGMYLKMLLGWHTYHKALARWTGGRSQGEGAEGDDDDDSDDDDDDDETAGVFQAFMHAFNVPTTDIDHPEPDPTVAALGMFFEYSSASAF